MEKTKMRKEKETNSKVNDKEKPGALILAELRARIDGARILYSLLNLK